MLEAGLTSVSGSQPISSLGSAAFVNHPEGIRLRFVVCSPSPQSSWMWGVGGKAGMWIQEEEAYSCLSDLSVWAFRCPTRPGTSPGWAVASRGSAGAFGRGSRRSCAQPHCIFLVSRLSWKKQTKKIPKTQPQPGFLILTAQPSQCLLKPQGQACW